MKRLLAGLATLLHTALALAVSPYISGERRPPAPVAEQLAPQHARLVDARKAGDAAAFQPPLAAAARAVLARLYPAAPHNPAP